VSVKILELNESKLFSEKDKLLFFKDYFIISEVKGLYCTRFIKDSRIGFTNNIIVRSYDFNTNIFIKRLKVLEVKYDIRRIFF